MRRPLLQLLAIIGAALGASANATAQDAADAKFYAEKIHPLLEANCFKCHGGGDKLKAEFRITSRAGLLRGGELGQAIDLENPSASLLLEMISYKDAEHQMPPKAKLAADEVALLHQWVEKGAPYDPALEIAGDPAESTRHGFTVSDEDRSWWSYVPVGSVEVPKVTAAGWHENAIDAFVFSQLDQAGLKPNSLAGPRTLIRRLSYDLTGLPPTAAEVSAFETAFGTDPDTAWQSLIDRLLASPQYGEKWARHWLDVVRYAESNGFERDDSKPGIWRYRDYVVDAFNSDKPYDQFVIEQIAGDEIAEPTQASLTATGYHRLMQWDDEPADRKQHVYDVLADNVLVTTEAFLATTLGCARCHDHKIDPLSQKDYYSFMAFFHGLTPYKTEGTIRTWADPAELATFEKERRQRLATEQKKLVALETDMTGWLKSNQRLTAADGAAAANGSTFVDDARGTPATWFYTTDQPAPGWKEVGEKVKSWHRAQAGFGKPGTPNTRITTEWTSDNIWMRTDFGLKILPETLVMDIYYDEDVEVFLNGVNIFSAKGFVTNYQSIELDRKALDALQTGKNVVAVHCRNKGGGQFIDLALRSGARNADSLPEALRRGGAKVKGDLHKHFGRDVVKQWNELKDRITQIQKETPGTPLNVVTETGPTPDPLHVHQRGSAHAPGDLVGAAFPAVLSGMVTDDPAPADASPVEWRGAKSSGRRLALAQWMVDPKNPLTARVIANRVWQHHFGRGIVASTSDFGKLGDLPTHPGLLDFLAAELVREGWSLKALHRLILTSRTYRLSSAPNAANLAADPQNLKHWRFDMRRLTAEEVRDSVLALSGKLNLKTGGPWVYPPLPAEVLATASRPGKGWPVTQDPAEHFRRSIYVHVKRSLSHPMLTDFDQAQTDSPCAVRFATTVPTQALAMLNSEFTNRQADLFADRLRSGSAKSPRDQISTALEIALQRPATGDEITHCESLLTTLKSEHGLNDEQALDRLALVILNLNEFLYLD